MKAERHSRSEVTARKGLSLYCDLNTLLSPTFCAGEESEEPAGVAPAEPVPGLDQALVLGLGQQAGDEVGPQVGEAEVVHVPGYDHIGPVALAQWEGGVERPVIWFDLPVEETVLLDRTVAVHRPGELVRLKYEIVRLRYCEAVWRTTDPILVSVGFRSEDRYSRSSVYFNMLPSIVRRLDSVYISKVTYLNVPIEFSATQE